MNVQTAFIYALITFLVIYGVQTLDQKYFSVENKDEHVFRNSLMCSIITWIIIIYFIYRAEIEFPDIALKKLEIFD